MLLVKCVLVIIKAITKAIITKATQNTRKKRTDNKKKIDNIKHHNKKHKFINEN